MKTDENVNRYWRHTELQENMGKNTKPAGSCLCKLYFSRLAWDKKQERGVCYLLENMKGKQTGTQV